MELVDEIRYGFAGNVGYNSAIKIKILGEKWPGWTFRRKEWYGVAIPIDNKVHISEEFANVKLVTDTLNFNNKENNMLVLITNIEELRYEFATICAEFVEVGKDGESRKNLLKDPIEWWKRWKKLIGNSIKDIQVHSVLGELMAYEELYDKVDVKWTGPDGSSHDIEGKNVVYEVKSTIMRYDYFININSQFQLKDNVDTYLIFCRFEKSNIGDSINDVVERLEKLGVNRQKIDEKLKKLGFGIGSSSRKEKYKLLEMKKFIIDDEFPLIKSDSFVGGVYPERVVKFTYKIDLSGLKCSVLKSVM